MLGPPAGSQGCIHELFELQAGVAPNAIAVKCREETLTYRELNEQANQLAHYLRKLGVGPEIPVALYLERSIKMVVAILGVLKAGGVYVPIDLAYPKERLGFMLEDSQAPLLLTQDSLREKVPLQAKGVINLDAEWKRIADEPRDNPSPVTTAENAAYIIYTSGSTGRPKGVLVTHHNVVRLLKQTAHWYGFNADDVWPLFHSYAFDVSVWELWGALFNGGRLIVVPYLVTRSPGEFYDLLAKERVTVLNQTPSAFRQLIWAETNAETKHELQLRYVICAGEALELQSLKPWFDRHGDDRPKVVNMYGITETTVHSTYRVIRRGDLTNGMGSVIGVPIPDLQIHLVDENLKPVPAGVPGEICVGGAGVARGYLNRPELNAKRFLPDPFSNIAGAKLYRSGDLAQINANGELEYLGRMDHQVKIRGFRVELGEIESALNRHPMIRESVVVAHDGNVGDKRLVAYVVAVASAPTVTELREYLANKIPDYMLPAVFMMLPRLPLTTNGKVDRRALPSPDGARPSLKTAYLAPRTEPEKALTEIWSKVLEVEQVGVDDNFFELGGDSIRSITILSRARERGLNLSLEDIFQHPTIAALVKCAESAKPEIAAVRTEPFSLVSPEDRAKLPPDVEDAYPLTRLQMGMFFYNELEPLSAMYHDVFSYRIQAPFDREKLEQALKRLANRHPILRTSFHLAGFIQPLQLVHRQAKVPFTVEDLTALPQAQQDQRLVRWIESEKRVPFDRAVAPLVRFHAQLRGERSFQFIISFHHSCLDGWSLAAVMTEIFQDYTALLSGKEVNLAPPRITYRDFVALELQSRASEQSRAFWQEKLAGARAQNLPRWPKSLRRGGYEQSRGPEIQIEADVFLGLKQLAQRAGVPLKTVLLAAHQSVMSLMAGQADVISGLISNGRPEAIDGEKLIGLFLNTVPLRQQLDGGSWLDLVKQTFAAEQEVVPHRRFPLAEVQKLTGGQALFETAFDFVHFHVYKTLQECRDLDLSEGHYFEANNLTTYTTFMLDVSSTQLELHIDYDPNVLCCEQIEQLSNYYVETLKAMAAAPDAPYDSFSPLAETETRPLLSEWNQTAVEYPADKTLPQLFEERVRENPEAVALVFEGRKLTFGDLSERAEQLAHCLHALNLVAEELVGVCLERSPEMVIALLAVLKAGGAYVPLDPTYPKERLAFMMNDARLRLVLTQRSLSETLPVSTAQILCVEDFTAPVNAGTTSAPGAIGVKEQTVQVPKATDLAYVIYTSGSTGQPKGVQVTHRSVVNLLTSIARTTSFTNRDNLLAVTTLSFDIAGLELFLPLITGAQITLASRETAGNGTQLGSLIESSGATVMQATPATWRLLLEGGWRGNPNLKIFCGGESLSRSLADQVSNRCAELWNFYGPTETTIWSSAWKVLPDEPVLIGRPLANTQFYILDGKLRPVPLGVAGELYIGGDGLARGYLNRPELTEEKFIANPFGGAASRRLYRTGDLARYLPDGQVECLGRIDQQVKIRGFRIEPAEIEAVLRQHKGIADALVTAREDALGEKRLVGYVISRNGPPSPLDLRDFIRAKLPLYMVPTQFVTVQQFPLTPNGKIDVRRLPSPENDRISSRPYVAARNVEEQGLAEIWQEVLELKQVGIDDDFFELGGESLSATRAFARINAAFATALTLREILDRPTIRLLAELVASSKGSAPVNRPVILRQPRALESV